MRLLLAVTCTATLACGGEPMPPSAMPGDMDDHCNAETVSISPLGLAFGRLIPGTSTRRTATLTYQGCAPATLEIATDGLLSEDCADGTFCLTSTPDLDLEPGESVPLELEFHPVATGVALGALIVSNCPTLRCRAELWLQGSAEESGLVCRPDPLDFGALSPGSCATQPVACTNVADRALSIENVALLEESSTDLSVAITTPIRLAPAETMEIPLAYCPQEEGRDQGTMLVVSSIEGRTASVAIGLSARSGGGRLDLPSVVEFGQVSLIAPARRPIRIYNTGAQRLEVFGVDTDPPFKPVLASGASLGAGESAHLWIEVEPILEGLVEGTVRLYSDDPVMPVRTLHTTVDGTNLAPCEIAVDRETVDFGSIALGEVGAEELVLTNEGTLDCMVTAATVVEVGSAFEVPDERSLVIGAGRSASIAIKFSPTGTIAPSAATLEVGVSSPTEPYRRVPLIGRGH